MKDLIISAAIDGRDKYSEIVKGLMMSIANANWQGDVRIYREWPSFIIPHAKIPYAFKYDMIRRAHWDGYDHVYWLDSVMRLVPGKSISDLLFNSSNGFVAFHNEGHDLEPYINDTARKILGIENLDEVRQCWGGALFFDFSNPGLRQFWEELQRYKDAFKNDSTKRDGFIGHRHDQAVISWLIYKNLIPMLSYGIIAAPKDVTDKTYIIYGDK